MKQSAHIDLWHVDDKTFGCQVLIGKISRHPNQHQFLREFQHTSRLVKLDREAGTAETENTIYTLGKELAS